MKQIGRELNVRYVLEGSVQRGGDRMRVNVQLIDAESGAHLWAERFDKPVADLFDMQDEIVARLAGTAQRPTHRRRGAPRRTARRSQFDGPLFSGRGLHQPRRDTRVCGTGEGILCARAGARSGQRRGAGRRRFRQLGRRHAYVQQGPGGASCRCRGGSDQGVSLAPNNAWAHVVLGNVQIFTNRPPKALPNASERSGSIAI